MEEAGENQRREKEGEGEKVVGDRSVAGHHS